MRNILYLFFTFSLLSGCSTSFKKEFDNKIETALQSDCNITQTEFRELHTFLLDNKEKVNKLNLVSPDGKVDNEALENYILVSRPYIKQKKNCSEIALNSGTEKIENVIEPKLYLERSGSMVYYDRRQSRGQFKGALTKLLNNFDYLNPAKSLIYVVNDSVYSCNMSFDGLVKEADIFNAQETKKGKGNYTDFNQIFRNILDNLSEGQMSIMFSDLIYSTKDMKEKNRIKILTEAENLTNNIFGKYADDCSVLVLKLKSDYIGSYYTYENRPFSYDGLRPYYICFFAKNATMEDFLTNEKYQNVRNFSKLPEFENFYFFSNDKNIVNPYYSIVLKDSENEGRFNQDNDELHAKTNYVHSIEDVKPSNNDILTINIGVDFSRLMLPNDFLTDTTNYVVDNLKDNFKVVRIQEEKNTPNITHKITISTNDAGKGKRDATIRLKKYFPVKWIEDSNSEDDRNKNIINFKDTTFGFKNMMSGIYNAYNRQNKEFYCSLNITLNN